MPRIRTVMALLLGITVLPGALNTKPWLNTQAIAETPNQPDLASSVEARFQRQPDNLPLPDFEEDDEYATDAEGFHAIYVDADGHVLGTFVNVPGAKIKVYASGQIELAEQDFTQEVEYYSNGRIRSIGDARFRYFSNGRISDIKDIEFSYFSSGRLRAIADVDFDYFSSGRLSAIEDVEFDYSSSGRLNTISTDQTRNGIGIVIVD